MCANKRKLKIDWPEIKLESRKSLGRPDIGKRANSKYKYRSNGNCVELLLNHPSKTMQAVIELEPWFDEPDRRRLQVDSVKHINIQLSEPLRIRKDDIPDRPDKELEDFVSKLHERWRKDAASGGKAGTKLTEDELNKFDRIVSKRAEKVLDKNGFDRREFGELVGAAMKEINKNVKGELFEDAIQYLFQEHTPHFKVKNRKKHDFSVLDRNKQTDTHEFDLIVRDDSNPRFQELGSLWLIECKNRPKEKATINPVAKLAGALWEKNFKTACLFHTADKETTKSEQKRKNLHNAGKATILVFLKPDLDLIVNGDKSLFELVTDKLYALKHF